MVDKDLDKNQLKKIAEKIINILMEKNKTYGNSLFEQGDFGVYVRASDKFSRIKNIINNHKEKYPEYTEQEKTAIANSLIDIVGYCLSWIFEFVDNNIVENELGKIW